MPALPSSQRAATSQAQTQCDGIIAKPTASMMVQYFKRPKNIKGVMKGLRQARVCVCLRVCLRVSAH